MSIFARTSDAQDNQISNLIGLFHILIIIIFYQLFVGGLMSYCVLYMLAFSDVQHFVLSYVFTLRVPCCDVHYVIRYV